MSTRESQQEGEGQRALRAPPLVERQREREAVMTALERARGGARQLLLLSGPAGLGKSALLDACLEAVADDAQVCLGRGDCVEQYGPGEPYLPVLDAVGRMGRGASGAAVVEALSRHAPLWLQQLPSLVDEARLASLEARTQGASPARMLREMAEALEALGSERVVVMALEDLHLADPSTCDLLSLLMRRREPARLLVLATLRGDAAPPHVAALRRELATSGACTEVTLSPLSESAVHEYMAGRLPGAPPAEGLVGSLYRRTQGHPLFLERMLEEIHGDGTLVVERGKWSLPTGMTVRVKPVPVSLQDLVLKRVEALAEPLRDAAYAASVAGLEPCAPEVAAALGVDDEEAERRCTQLADKSDLIVATGIGHWPDGTLSAGFRFTHAMLHEVVYGAVEPARRIRMHRRIAAARSRAWAGREHEIGTLLRVHHERGQDFAAALDCAEAAGLAALERDATHEAIGHLQAAIRLVETVSDQPRELSLRQKLGHALTTARGWTVPAVYDNYRRARALCQELGADADLRPVLHGLIAYHQVRGETRQSQAVGEELLDAPGGDAFDQVHAHAAQMVSVYGLGDFVATLSHAAESLRHYRRQDHDRHVAAYGGHDPAVATLAWSAPAMWILGFPATAMSVADTCVALCRALDHPFSSTLGHYVAAKLQMLVGDDARAIELLETALDLSERYGFPFVGAMGGVTWIELTEGRKDPERAAARMREIIDEHKNTGALYGVTAALAHLVTCQRRAGQAAAALATVEEALSIVESSSQHTQHAELLSWRAELAFELNAGAAQDALADLERARVLAAQQRAQGWGLRVAQSRVGIAERLGEGVEPAVAALAAVLGGFDEGAELPELAQARAVLERHGISLPEPDAAARRGLVTESMAAIGERGEALLEAEVRRSLVAGVGFGGAVSTGAPASAGVADAGAAGAEADTGDRFVREGDFWTLRFDGKLCRVKDSRGMGYILLLLRAPNRELHVLDLAAEPGAESPEQAATASRALASMDAGGIDERARADYGTRVAELQRELSEAQENNDLGRVEALQAELEFLEQELSRAFGLSGRRRATGTPAERARVNVTRAIKTAIRRIGEHHAELAHYLGAAIKTGTFCVYVTDPRRTDTWELSG